MSRRRRVALIDHQRELQYFRMRLVISGALVAIAFLGLFSRFIYLQIVQHAHYRTLAESNRITIVPIVPNRGLIIDRNGIVLAHNYSAYALEIAPSKINRDLEVLIDELSTVVEITPKDRRRFKKLLGESKSFLSLPIRNRLTDEEVARFTANHYRFPGVEINARLFRQYPGSEITSHVIGHIGRITDKDIEDLEENELLANYRGTDHIGKTGIEQKYERELHGTTGYEQVEVDASGRAVRTLARTPPISGNNLILTLDWGLQQIAAEAFGEYRGSLVAIDPNNGSVLALISKPGFDPNLFVDGIDTKSWTALNTSLDKPLINRALQGLYPPGSTFKPFMALAGLELNKRSEHYSIHDPGYYTLSGSSHQFRDWKVGGHGDVDLHRALVISCDTYFYGLANDLGIDNIYKFISRFGFGQKAGIDIGGEAPGILPSQEWKQKRFNQRWYAGETISVGIGQGYVASTPLQMAQATSILANNGTVYTPHLVNKIVNSTTNVSRSIAQPPARLVSLTPENLKIVKDAMLDVTRPGGTAALAGANAEYAFAGKTGTAQVIAIKQNQKYDERNIDERYRDHALFIAFAPAEKPTIALVVLVENGGHGSTTAAPIARQVIDYYLLGKKRTPVPAKVKEEPSD